MTGIRDPAFWRRFSMAAHLEAEKAGPFADSSSTTTTTTMTTISSSSSQPDPKHSESWLQRHHAKRKRARIIGWLIALFVCLLIAGVSVACWWLSRHGWEFWKDQNQDKKPAGSSTSTSN